VTLSYIHAQLTTARRRDLLETAERDRPARQARAHDRSRFRRATFRREARQPRFVEYLLGASAPRTATR
jgi:hypothetical protein